MAEEDAGRLYTVQVAGPLLQSDQAADGSGSSGQSIASERVIAIEPSARLKGLAWGEVWSYRELLLFFVWRDIKVRYKQSVLGVAWAILQPLLTMVIFTVFFGHMARISSGGIPYPLFSYTGLLVWTFFAQATAQAAQSLVGSAQLITKVYFPRVLVPTAAVLGGLVDLAVASPLLLVLMGHYRVWPGWEALFAPLFVLLAVVTAGGVGLWLSALNVEYRDVRYIVPFLIQVWLFLTPVIYPASLAVPMLERVGLPRWVLGLNPMVGVVEGFRCTLLGATWVPVDLLLASVLSAILTLISGAMYFRSVARSFADVV